MEPAFQTAPQPPTTRRLRLPGLLKSLGAEEAPRDATARREIRISVGEIVDRAQEAGFGFVLAVLALVAIPFFGLSTPFGLAVALCGAQMLIGRTRPWMPGRARRRQLRMSMLDRVMQMLSKWTRWLGRITRRRWEGMFVGPGWVLIGLGVVLLGLGLALPLPIPGSNLIFIVPILIYAIGLLEQDGAMIALAHLAMIADMTVLALFGRTVAEVLIRCGHWIGGLFG